MNILSIGNSFSQDAHRYLHRIARADGVTLHTFNLYIGGCPLSLHYRNMLSEAPAYTLEMNGTGTGFKVSLKEALLNRDWDLVTIQQVSTQSPLYDTYQPYLNQLAEYIRHCVPKAKLAIHQTWAYEQSSSRLQALFGYQDQADMFRDLKNAYQTAARDIHADYIIPGGEVIQALLANGIEKVHRDCHHASHGVGRYALGLVWYAFLTGNTVVGNSFGDFDDAISSEEITIAQKCAMEVAAQYRK